MVDPFTLPVKSAVAPNGAETFVTPLVIVSTLDAAVLVNSDQGEVPVHKFILMLPSVPLISSGK